jgi:hypothetical protein
LIISGCCSRWCGDGAAGFQGRVDGTAATDCSPAPALDPGFRRDDDKKCRDDDEGTGMTAEAPG